MKSSKLFRFFASLKLAVVSILSLAIVLSAATILESYFGMRGVHVLVYGTWWFYGLLFFLGLNVFCAALIRYPWKKTQTGFVVTHLGILVILFGSFLTQQFGVDGSLPVVEGAQDHETILNELELTISQESTGKTQIFRVPESARSVKTEWMQIDFPNNQTLIVDHFYPRTVPNRRIIASVLPGVGVPAVNIELKSSRFHLNEWVMVESPEKGGTLNLGPAVVVFRKLWNAKEETEFLNGKDQKVEKKESLGHLLVEQNGKQFRIGLSEARNQWVPFGSTGLEVKVDKYLPYAVVEKNELVTRSNEPVNPAVQLTLRQKGSETEPEKHTVFANFPEFTTLHGAKKLAGQTLGATFRLVMETSGQNSEMGIVGKNRGRLLLAESADGAKVLYRVFGAQGDEKGKGEAKLGEFVPTGWMDSEFRVAQWIKNAVLDESPKNIEYIQRSSDNYLPAIRLAKKGTTESYWLTEGMGRNVSMDGEEYFIHFTKRKLLLPFQIFLEKFTVGMDPGTSKPGTYESDVMVKDPANGVEQRAKISMNEPLKYGGYTLYQASYQMEEGRPPISIFSVNRDPGRMFKYLGSIIMVLGIIFMFYMNPHYWNILLGRRGDKHA